jgi:hypothetical protein
MQGWAGGKWHTKEFERALAAAGYTVTDHLHADVVIAHSAACYMLNLKSPAIYYFLVDPVYWPGKSIYKRMWEHTKNTIKLTKARYGWKATIIKSFWSIIYIFAKPNYTIDGFKNHDNLVFLQALGEKKVVVIRNDQDEFCSPDIQVALAGYKNISYLALPGIHDDYYYNPQPYIDLLPKEL